MDASTQPIMSFDRSGDGTLTVRFAGAWTIERVPPAVKQLQEAVDSTPGIAGIVCDSEQLTAWDSSFLAFLTNLGRYCADRGLTFGKDGLPRGVQRLLALAAAVPERTGARRESGKVSWPAAVGRDAIRFGQATREMLAFLGEAVVAVGNLLRGKAGFRRSDFILFIRQCGAEALPIVSLISVLVGLILAFIGAVQLALFGAQIYVASLVGISMIRVMGAVMTGVIVAGRTGAAFAAQLGTMTVNEEIDALATLGIAPMEFLVLPRMLALLIMMPLLCVYADLMGVLGGLIVGVFMLDLNAVEYLNQTRDTVPLTHFWIGLFHSAVFGILVALSGCLRGMQCGRSASAVGEAATSAVVTGIVSIVVATAIITVVCNVLGI